MVGRRQDISDYTQPLSIYDGTGMDDNIDSLIETNESARRM
jgi:hypothetical protein